MKNKSADEIFQSVEKSLNKKKGRKLPTRMGGGLNLPIEMNIPVEVATRIENEEAIDEAYRLSKQKKLVDKYNKNLSKTRKIADEIFMHFRPLTGNKELSPDDIRKIAKNNNISEYTLRMMISDLNFLPNNNFDMVLMPVPKKAGHYQSVTRNLNDYEKWDSSKRRKIVTMRQIIDNAAEKTAPEMRVKQIQQHKEKAKEKEKKKKIIVEAEQH